MKIPKSVLIIGAAHLMTYRTLKPYRSGSTPLEISLHDYLIATNHTRTVLYLFPNRTTGKKRILKDKTNPQRGFIHTAMEYDIPTLDLKKIGIVESVQYSSDWWEGHYSKYEHTFAVHPALYADKQTRFSVIAIKPQQGRIVNESGII